MTEKKTRAKKAKPPQTEVSEASNTVHLKMADGGIQECTEEESRAHAEALGVKAYPSKAAETPERGPDYHITDAGEILLDSGGPIPEDHHVHPAHRLLALARKDARGKS